MFKAADLFDLAQTEHAAIFEGCNHAWEALKKIEPYLAKVTRQNPPKKFPGASIGERVVIGEGTVVEPGATVRVDGAQGNVLTWHFRAPGDPRTTPLEGISGPGDSGGPAFIRIGGRICIAGVSSAQRRDVVPGQENMHRGQGRYGVEEVYMRISQFRPWIEAAIRPSA